MSARILVAVPALEYVHTEFAISLAVLMHEAQVRFGRIFFSRNAYLCISRTMAAEYALEAGASHILYLDTDIMMQPDVAAKLLSHGKPIVAATYPKKKPPREMAGTPIGKVDWTKRLWPFSGIPLGCALIETEVFRRMSRPWFAERGATVYGEDLTFSEFAREAGYELLVDLEVTQQIGHVGSTIWSLSPNGAVEAG